MNTNKQESTDMKKMLDGVTIVRSQSIQTIHENLCSFVFIRG